MLYPFSFFFLFFLSNSPPFTLQRTKLSHARRRNLVIAQEHTQSWKVKMESHDLLLWSSSNSWMVLAVKSRTFRLWRQDKYTKFVVWVHIIEKVKKLIKAYDSNINSLQNDKTSDGWWNVQQLIIVVFLTEVVDRGHVVTDTIMWFGLRDYRF
jgi:hypothetical protein